MYEEAARVAAARSQRRADGQAQEITREETREGAPSPSQRPNNNGLTALPSPSSPSSPPRHRSRYQPENQSQASHVASMYSIQLLSRVDLLSSAVGALICAAFVKNEAFKEGRETPFPWEQVVGMIFTTSVCPLTMLWSFPFYEKWRNVLVVLLRMSFMIGTLAHYDDVPHRVFNSWLGFIGMMLITARCSVICWGGFGWLLPFRYHLWMQGIHALLAFRLIPDSCAMPSATRYVDGTFLSLNEDRWRRVASVLDWPLVLFGGVNSKLIQQNTSAWATCVGVNVWCITVVGWVVPSLALSYLYPRLSARARTMLRRDGVFLVLLVCTLYWIAIRAFMAKVLS